jgi:hypothetical protein
LLARQVRLLDNATLRSQLAALERRVSAADRESVSHPQIASAHDDVSAAVCGVICIAARSERAANVAHWKAFGEAAAKSPWLNAEPRDPFSYRSAVLYSRRGF